LHFHYKEKQSCVTREIEIGERALFGGSELSQVSIIIRWYFHARHMSREVRYLSDCSVSENPDRMYLDETNKSHPRITRVITRLHPLYARAHTHTHARARVSRTYHVYSHLRGIARIRFPSTSFFSCFFFLEQNRTIKIHNRFEATAFGPWSDNTAVNPRFTAIRVHVYARASRLAIARDSWHTNIHACTARTYIRVHSMHTHHTPCDTHTATSAPLYVRDSRRVHSWETRVRIVWLAYNYSAGSGGGGRWYPPLDACPPLSWSAPRRLFSEVM